jgi:hypothetical protein
VAVRQDAKGVVDLRSKMQHAAKQILRSRTECIAKEKGTKTYVIQVESTAFDHDEFPSFSKRWDLRCNNLS